ncbi:VOC family protein [Paraflavitalea soli]|uniref:VOC family protein n=2 Tax=Paraflavitalea soli TaxID=2315862 RepID=A0A3B7MYZ8_9BACT|nr:VOC family protein [Paraflavitalea soli]
MKHPFINCLWFDDQAEEAARFYTTVFPNSGIDDITRYGAAGYEIHKRPEGSVMTVEFHVSNLKFMGLNGGPLFKFNPSISYFVVCETAAETDTLWQKLSEGGKVLMELDKYDWSEKFGWVQDRYGLSWQVSLGKLSDTNGQQITPSIMYVQEQAGRAEEAIRFYTSIFEGSAIRGIRKNGPGENEPEGSVKHAQFNLAGQEFMAMDSALQHPFTFNEAISFVIHCDTQAEIDYYWNKLTEDGQESSCGWLKDKFGVSWQVEPIQLVEMLKSPDKEKTERVTNAYLRMKKFDLPKLEAAFEG